MATSVLSRLSCYFKSLILAIGCLFLLQSVNAQCPYVAPAVTPAGFDALGIYNGHSYYISKNYYTGGNISTAVALAQAGLPVTPANQIYAAAIVNKAENDFIACRMVAYNITKFGGDGKAEYGGNVFGDPHNAWIGFTDAASENNFVWSNGQPICFINWNFGEPNNNPGESSNGEDYTEMLIVKPPYPVPVSPEYPTGINDPLGKWNDWFNTTSPLPVIIEVGPAEACTPPPPPPPAGDQGCSHGYWKNHEESWQVYTTGQTLEAVFDVPNSLGMDNFTLMQALNFGGGGGVPGAARNLFKQAVGALLNAAHSQVNYPLTTAQVIAQVNAALATNNRDAMLTLAGTLDGYNNLHGASICSETTSSISRSGNPFMEEIAAEKTFAISGYPNPSRSGFSIQIDGLSTEKVSIRVTDLTGRLVEQRSNIATNQVLKIGDNYRAGMYYIQVTQGTNTKQLKVVKQ